MRVTILIIRKYCNDNGSICILPAEVRAVRRAANRSWRARTESNRINNNKNTITTSNSTGENNTNWSVCVLPAAVHAEPSVANRSWRAPITDGRAQSQIALTTTTILLLRLLLLILRVRIIRIGTFISLPAKVRAVPRAASQSWLARSRIQTGAHGVALQYYYY